MNNLIQELMKLKIGLILKDKLSAVNSFLFADNAEIVARKTERQSVNRRNVGERFKVEFANVAADDGF